MVLKIYGFPTTHPSRGVLIFARAANIEHEFIPVDLMRNEQKGEAYLRVNPLGQVPAMVDGDFHLSESHAILTYLATTRQVADHWYPSDPQKRALVDRYLHWHHLNLHRGAYMTYARVLAPLLGHSPPPALVSEAEDVFAKAVTVLEGWLSERRYIAGEEVSVADLVALCEITQQRLCDLDLSPFPHIQAWVMRLFEIPAVVEGHRDFNAFQAMLAAKKQSN